MNTEQESQEPQNDDGFTVRQQRFIEEYCVDGNCTQAAKRAGYSPDTAYSIGSRLLKNVEIRAAINERLATLALGAAEVTKLTSEIAQSRLNEYFIIRQVQGYEETEQYVTVLAEKQREEIAYIQEFAQRENLMLVDKDGLTQMGKRLQEAKEKLLEYELEIMHYGKAVVRLVAGAPTIIERAELDLVALAKAKEGGRLKSYSVGKDGIKVETYAADAALDKLARMHGLYEKDNRQLAGTDVEIIIGGEEEAEA
jgi:phage terminase small subunit